MDEEAEAEDLGEGGQGQGDGPTGVGLPPGSLRVKVPPGSPRDSRELLDHMRKVTDTVILGFSCGKDSVASLIVLLEAGFRVIPYYCWTYPDTSFELEPVRFYERHFGIKIIRTAAPSFWQWLNSGTAMGPADYWTIWRLQMQNYDYDDIRAWIADDHGIPREKAWGAVGIRYPDSIIRQAAINKHGPISKRRSVFYPVFDFNKADVIALLKKHRCPLPEAYQAFGRSFGGAFEYRFLQPIRELYPEDWERVKFCFQLAWVELARARIAVRHNQINNAMKRDLKNGRVSV